MSIYLLNRVSKRVLMNYVQCMTLKSVGQMEIECPVVYVAFGIEC
jgi:hypothetical protein